MPGHVAKSSNYLGPDMVGRNLVLSPQVLQTKRIHHIATPDLNIVFLRGQIKSIELFGAWYGISRPDIVA